MNEAALQYVAGMRPDQLALVVAARLKGERFVAIPMSIPAWGWCVLDSATGSVDNGCIPESGAISTAARLNGRRS